MTSEVDAPSAGESSPVESSEAAREAEDAQSGGRRRSILGGGDAGGDGGAGGGSGGGGAGGGAAAGGAAGGSTLFERMASLSRGASTSDDEDEDDDDEDGDSGSSLSIPRFLGRQNNQ